MYLCSVVFVRCQKKRKEGKRSSKSIRQKIKFTLNWPLKMTINSVRIKRSKKPSIGRQLNLIPRSFSASPIFQRKSPGTRLVLTYTVKGTRMRRSGKRQSQSPSDKDGGLNRFNLTSTNLSPLSFHWIVRGRAWFDVTPRALAETTG